MAAVLSRIPGRRPAGPGPGHKPPGGLTSPRGFHGLRHGEFFDARESAPACAMRDRIREQFTDRYNEHAAITAELDALRPRPRPPP